MVTLSIQPRDAKASIDTLRNGGLVPAIFYGPKEEATPISVKKLELDRVWKQAGETTIVKLSGVGEDKDTLIHDMQFHPVTGTLVHADFYVLEKGKKIRLNVPLEFVGTSLAEKAGHIVVKTLHEIEIEVAPAELPHHLEVDISKLENPHDHISVKEIVLPPSAELITDGEDIVVSITEFKEEKLDAAPEAVVPAQVGEPGAEGGDAAAAAPEAKKEEKK